MLRFPALRAGGRKIFISGIFPTAAYAAEHDAWNATDIAWLQSAALRCFGLLAPGVPHDVALLGVPAGWDAAFRQIGRAHV